MTIRFPGARVALALLVHLGGVAFGLASAVAVESWTDERLPIRDGLTVWFDASRQNAAREAFQLGPIAPNIPIDFLLDGSGRRRHLHQPLTAARPIFRQRDSLAWLSFDGQD